MPPRPIRPQPGVSLLEVMIVIAILGVLSSVIGLSWRKVREEETTEQPVYQEIARARQRALKQGSPVTIRVVFEEDSLFITTLPDGTIIGAERVGFDRLSGRTGGINSRAGRP
jgi:prepilin-type N-terminal cleavage/methylation domain-containing protein